MPPKRRLETATVDGDDPWGSAHELPNKKLKSRTLMGEYDKDPGLQPSKQFQKWGDWQTKFIEKEKADKRDFATTLKAQTQAHQQQIGSLLDKTCDNLTVAGEKHARALREACAVESPSAKLTSTNTAHELRQESPLFNIGQRLLLTSRDLVNMHEETNRKAIARKNEITEHLDKMHSKWSSDMIQLDEVLQFGLDYGAKIVECSLSPSTTDEERRQVLAPDRNPFREAGQTVLDMYQKSTERLSGAPTWGERIKSYTEKMLALVAVSEGMGCDA